MIEFMQKRLSLVWASDALSRQTNLKGYADCEKQYGSLAVEIRTLMLFKKQSQLLRSWG